MYYLFSVMCVSKYGCIGSVYSHLPSERIDAEEICIAMTAFVIKGTLMMPVIKYSHGSFTR